MGKNKKGVAGNKNEQDKSEQKPKKGKKKKDEEGSKKVASRESSRSMRVARMKRHFERRPAKKLRRILRNNPPSWAGDWAEHNLSFDVLRRISREGTSVGQTAKAALASKGRS